MSLSVVTTIRFLVDIQSSVDLVPVLLPESTPPEPPNSRRACRPTKQRLIPTRSKSADYRTTN